MKTQEAYSTLQSEAENSSASINMTEMKSKKLLAASFFGQKKIKNMSNFLPSHVSTGHCRQAFWDSFT